MTNDKNNKFQFYIEQTSCSSVLDAVGGVGGVVVVGPQHRLQALLSASAAVYAHNHTRPHWLLVPTGPVQEKVFQGEAGREEKF